MGAVEIIVIVASVLFVVGVIVGTIVKKVRNKNNKSHKTKSPCFVLTEKNGVRAVFFTLGASTICLFDKSTIYW